MSTSRLLHPIAGPSFVAIVDSTIVGLAHVELPRRDRGAEFSIQFDHPGVALGLGAKLLRSVIFHDIFEELGSASCLVARNNRAALALAASAGLERRDLEVSLIRLSSCSANLLGGVPEQPGSCSRSTANPPAPAGAFGPSPRFATEP
ncbi:MAG: hypothetical protein R2705_04485 [Ilumatobacteraceae bacterium]